MILGSAKDGIQSAREQTASACYKKHFVSLSEGSRKLCGSWMAEDEAIIIQKQKSSR